MVRRSIFLAFFIVAGLYGWHLGNQATQVPQVTPPRTPGYANVTVFSKTEDSKVLFYWLLLSDGRVAVSAINYKPDGGGGITTVQLEGGSILVLDDPTVSVRSEPSSTGPLQYIDLEDGDQVIGRPVGTWREEVNGRTEARLPDVWLAFEDGPGGARVPSQESELYAGIQAAVGESVDFFSPTSLPGGEVRVLEDQDAESGNGSRVYWAISPARAPDKSYFLDGLPAPSLPPAVARLADPSGIAKAQRDLLVSGAALGLAAAALFEMFAPPSGPGWRRRAFRQVPEPTAPAAVVPTPDPAVARAVKRTGRRTATMAVAKRAPSMRPRAARKVSRGEGRLGP